MFKWLSSLDIFFPCVFYIAKAPETVVPGEISVQASPYERTKKSWENASTFPWFSYFPAEL